MFFSAIWWPYCVKRCLAWCQSIIFALNFQKRGQLSLRHDMQGLSSVKHFKQSHFLFENVNLFCSISSRWNTFFLLIYITYLFIRKVIKNVNLWANVCLTTSGWRMVNIRVGWIKLAALWRPMWSLQKYYRVGDNGTNSLRIPREKRETQVLHLGSVG